MKIALPRDRKARFVFWITAGLPPLAILVLNVLLPMWRDPLAEFAIVAAADFSPKVYDVDGTAATAGNAAKASTAMQQLLLKKNALEFEQAYLLSRLDMATSDSIGLGVDLTDSVATLEIRGVPVRRCKITRFTVPGGLQRREAVYWLSTPFELREAAASLPKAPIRVRKAPSDTIEAKEKAEPDIPIEKRDVYFILHFDKNLSLAVAQTQPTSAIGWLHRVGYLLERGWLPVAEDLSALAHLKRPTARVHMRLEMSREDAKAIYRALPTHANLALRL